MCFLLTIFMLIFVATNTKASRIAFKIKTTKGPKWKHIIKTVNSSWSRCSGDTPCFSSDLFIRHLVLLIIQHNYAFITPYNLTSLITFITLASIQLPFMKISKVIQCLNVFEINAFEAHFSVPCILYAILIKLKKLHHKSSQCS